jgi:hypothetical protein
MGGFLGGKVSVASSPQLLLKCNIGVPWNHTNLWRYFAVFLDINGRDSYSLRLEWARNFGFAPIVNVTRMPETTT